MFLSSSNPIIHSIIKKEYQEEGYVLIDDLFILSLDEVKNSEIKYCFYCPSEISSQEAKETLKYYQNHCETYEINNKLFNRLSSKENCAGILVLAKPHEFKLNNLKRDPLVLVLDGLEIAGNIGTIFRSAEAINIDLIIFTNLRAKVPSDLLVRASRGMMFYVPFVVMKNTSEVNSFLIKSGIRRVICEPEQGINFKEFNYKGGLALIMGNERYGVDKGWFDLGCEYLKIPMYGRMDSLNVAVATSLIIYEAKARR